MRLLPLLLTSSLLLSANIASLQYQRINIDHSDGKSYIIERYIPAECLDVGITPEQVWEKEDVPSVCTQQVVMTVGNITEIKLVDTVQTYAELEVLSFLKSMQKSHGTMLLIDGRGEEWYRQETIPGAVNVWYKSLTKPDIFPREYRAALKLLHIIDKGSGRYDVSNVPELLIFCNGPWCSQSSRAINALLQMGYPAEKIKWYRGGMHTWKSLSLTTTAVQAP